MQITRRGAILGGAAALTGGTLAAAALWRKPAPVVFTLANAVTPGLKPLEGFVAKSPPSPPPMAAFFDGDGVSHGIAEFAGQGVILNLWATWCIPCVAEMPELQAMAKVLAGERVVVLPLSSDRGGAAVVRKFYASHDITDLGVWLDPKGEAARAWGARGLPTTLIIDRQGREVARLEGAFEWASPAALAEIRRLVG